MCAMQPSNLDTLQDPSRIWPPAARAPHDLRGHSASRTSPQPGQAHERSATANPPHQTPPHACARASSREPSPTAAKASAGSSVTRRIGAWDSRPRGLARPFHGEAPVDRELSQAPGLDLLEFRTSRERSQKRMHSCYSGWLPKASLASRHLALSDVLRPAASRETSSFCEPCSPCKCTCRLDSQMPVPWPCFPR